MATKHTAGPWRANATCLYGSIVSSQPTGNPSADDPRNVEAYGGYLVAESVLPNNLGIITAAPEMFDLLTECLANSPGRTSDWRLRVEALLARVTS